MAVRTPRPHTIGLLVTMAGAIAGAGCQGLNLSPQPGPHVQLDTLRPTADFYARVDKPLAQSGSSLAGLSRDNWTDTTFYVPVTGVEHKPTYTTDRIPGLTETTARQRGEFPTQATAVEGVDGDSTGLQAAEAAIGPFRAGWDILWMIPKMFDTPPDSTVSSPRHGYERDPHPSLATNGGLRDAGLGVTLQPLPGSTPVAPAPTTPAGEPLPPAQPTPAPTIPPAAPAPAPGQPTTEPAPATPPGGLPSGALGGGDSPKRKEQQTPPTPPKDPPKKDPKEEKK